MTFASTESADKAFSVRAHGLVALVRRAAADFSRCRRPRAGKAGPRQEAVATLPQPVKAVLAAEGELIKAPTAHACVNTAATHMSTLIEAMVRRHPTDVLRNRNLHERCQAALFISISLSSLLLSPCQLPRLATLKGV